MTLEIGQTAPDFTLKTKQPEGLKEVTLSSHKGKENVVLLFFPLAFTGGCTQEMCSTSEDLNAYKALNAQVYGISVDSPFSLEAFADAHKITVPMLSDMKREVIKAYGIEDKELLNLGGVAQRSVFVINKDGKIIYKWVTPDPKQLPNFDEVKQALSEKVSA